SPAAWREPALFAAVHAFFVLCASAVAVVSWHIIEESHRASRAELETSERRFRSLIDNSSDVVTVIDPNGKISYDSPSSAAVLGYPAAERMGRSAFDYIHPEDIGRAAEV